MIRFSRLFGRHSSHNDRRDDKKASIEEAKHNADQQLDAFDRRIQHVNDRLMAEARVWDRLRDHSGD